MDKEKQPGIQIETIALLENHFKRAPMINLEENFRNEITYLHEVSWSEDKQKTAVYLKCKMDGFFDEKKQIEIEVLFVGVFAIDPNSENMDLIYFSNNHAPAIIFPYIRHQINQDFIQSALPGFILPPMNVLAMIQESQKKDESVSLEKKN
jgi:preprotein translocase subunit SecB